MPNLHIASINLAIPRPAHSRRDRLARRIELGITAITGGRAPAAVSTRSAPGSYADFARRAEERRNPTPAEDYVDLPCDV